MTEPGERRTSSAMRAVGPVLDGNGPSAATRASLVWIERALLVTGTILLGFYATARVDGWISSSAALEGFDRATSPRPSPERIDFRPRHGGQEVDMSLWSLQRIRGFRDSLSLTEDRAMAVLELDQLALRVPVFEGTDDLVLNRGAGWIQGTARPGEDGNVGIAGHRDGFFRGLMHAQMGDPIRLRAPTRTMSYRIDGIEIVEPEDVYVLLPRALPSITLVTCYPFYYTGSAPHRFIVHATLQREGGSEE